QSYQHAPGQGVVVEDILRQIEGSHFAVVDITRSNPNVLLELGAVRAWKKHTMLVRRADDHTELPFDITAYHIFKYSVKAGQFVWHRSKTEEVPLEEALETFVRKLEADASFLAAETVAQPSDDHSLATGATGRGKARRGRGRERLRETSAEDRR